MDTFSSALMIFIGDLKCKNGPLGYSVRLFYLRYRSLLVFVFEPPLGKLRPPSLSQFSH